MKQISNGHEDRVWILGQVQRSCSTDQGHLYKQSVKYCCGSLSSFLVNYTTHISHQISALRFTCSTAIEHWSSSCHNNGLGACCCCCLEAIFPCSLLPLCCSSSFLLFLQYLFKLVVYLYYCSILNGGLSASINFLLIIPFIPLLNSSMLKSQKIDLVFFNFLSYFNFLFNSFSIFFTFRTLGLGFEVISHTVTSVTFDGVVTTLITGLERKKQKVLEQK